MSEAPLRLVASEAPLNVPSTKRNGSKWRDPVVTFPPGYVRPHFGVYVIRVLDSISSSCRILLTFQSCVAQLSIIFSLPRVSCTSKARFFILACCCCCFLRNVLYTDFAFWSLWLKLGIDVLSSLFFLQGGKKLNVSRMQKKKALYHRKICFLSLSSVLTFWSKNVEKHRETTAVAILASFSGNKWSLQLNMLKMKMRSDIIAQDSCCSCF